MERLVFDGQSTKAVQSESGASLSSLPNDILRHVMCFLGPPGASSFVQASSCLHEGIGSLLNAVDKKACTLWLEERVKLYKNKKSQLYASDSWAEVVKDNGSWLVLTGFFLVVVMIGLMHEDSLRSNPFVLALVGMMLALEAVLLLPLIVQYYKVRSCDEQLKNLESVKRSL